MRKAPEGAEPSQSQYAISMRRARGAETTDDLRAVMLDIADRAASANSAAAVDTIQEIARAAARTTLRSRLRVLC